MNLWVRSQDKEKLLKINGIQYQNCKLVENETVEANILIGFYSSYENEFLEVYKTKERSLEILDEIQEAELGNFHYKCPSNVKVSNNEDTIVYQMPAE